MDEILKCNHSDEIMQHIIPYGSVYYAVQGGSSLSVDKILKYDNSNERC